MKKITVLIVDDSSVMRKIVERSLRTSGLAIERVLEAEDGDAALAVARENSLDMILSDINMPKMDGLEFMRQLRSVEKARGVPVVMITTEGGESRVMEAISLGARGYIHKPFSAQQVKESVLPLLEPERQG